MLVPAPPRNRGGARGLSDSDSDPRLAPLPPRRRRGKVHADTSRTGGAAAGLGLRRGGTAHVRRAGPRAPCRQVLRQWLSAPHPARVFRVGECDTRCDPRGQPTRYAGGRRASASRRAPTATSRGSPPAQAAPLSDPPAMARIHGREEKGPRERRRPVKPRSVWAGLRPLPSFRAVVALDLPPLGFLPLLALLFCPGAACVPEP